MKKFEIIDQVICKKCKKLQIRCKCGSTEFEEIHIEREINSIAIIQEQVNEIIDKPIEVMEIEEDNRPFAQRLQSLERDRGSVSIQKTNRLIIKSAG